MDALKTMVIFAHPALEKSRANALVAARLVNEPLVTFKDLYEEYPDFQIDVEREKCQIVEHDLLVFVHPFYWYSCPPLLKHWIDLVLAYGFAYGEGGEALRDKKWLSAITTGGGREAYAESGHNNYPVGELMRPIEQTARLCHMDYLRPHVIFAVNRMQDEELVRKVDDFCTRLRLLIQRGNMEFVSDSHEFFSDWQIAEVSS